MQKFSKTFFAAILFALFNTTFNPMSAKADEAKLSRVEARERKALVSNVRYDLTLELTEKSPKFKGTVQITFNFKKSEAAKALRIDFDRGTILRASLNRATVDPAVLRSGGETMLLLPLENLIDGQNVVTLEYEHDYSTIGKGLYRFVDQEDQQEYIYTDLEPYGANQVLPCFDQPDLKAVFKLTIDAPQNWKVIGNGEEESRQLSGKRQTMSFKESAPISTYVFAALAGPYEVWKDQYKNIPIRVFARKSIAKFVGIEDWLNVTKKGLAFYEDFYHFPYPFKKYDQILVPDFGPGAMENVGAVTFNESYYVFRSPPTTKQKMVLAETVLHEMAHMWFGDLVTMDWWDGLWLNESFATYMSTLAVKALGAYDPNAVDVYFFSEIKKWAYFEDGLRTTHAIQADVADTSEALANFDGITYGKGGASLKQLHYLLGDAHFKKGIRAYFQNHQYQNTTLDDFIGSLAQASGLDLNTWQKQWLRTKGTNTLRATWTCDQGLLKSVTLTQGSAANADVLSRSHKTELGLYYFSKTGDIEAAQIVPVTYASEKQTFEMKNLKRQGCPSFVYPNEGDHDFAKAIFDLDTVKALKPYVSRFKNGLTRQLVWYSLWTQVEAGILPAREYLDIAIRHLPYEKDLQTVEEVVSNLLGQRYQDLSIAKILRPEDRAGVYDQLWEIASAKLARAAAGSPEQLVWLKTALRATRSPKSMQWTEALLDGAITIPGQKIEYDLRWDVIDALGRAGALTQARIQSELKLDASDTSYDRAFGALSLVQDPKLNSVLYRMFQGEKVVGADQTSPLLIADLKSTRLQRAMHHYLSLLDEPKAQATVDAYFENTPKMSRDLGENFMWDYGTYLYPSTCDDQAVSARESFFEATDRLFPVVAKEARNAREVELRCIEARKLQYSVQK